MLNGELEVGYTLIFLFFLFVFVIFIPESLMDWCVQTKCAPRSLIFQFTRSLVFWADLPAVALYRWLFISPAFSNRILTSTRNGEAHSLAYFRRISLEGPHTLHWKIEYKSNSAVLLCDMECGWGRMSLGIDSGSIYGYVLRHLFLSYSVDLNVRRIDGTPILDRRGLF